MIDVPERLAIWQQKVMLNYMIHGMMFQFFRFCPCCRTYGDARINVPFKDLFSLVSDRLHLALIAYQGYNDR